MRALPPIGGKGPRTYADGSPIAKENPYCLDPPCACTH